jgi:hypothetical protein
MRNDDPVLLPSRESISAIVAEVFEAWLQGAGSQKVTCAFDINSGPCSDFAEDVVSIALARFPGADIEVEDYEDYLSLEGLSAQGIHYYVRFENWYFDASMPDGMPSPDFLPTCRSIRICATSLEEDEEPSDGFSLV